MVRVAVVKRCIVIGYGNTLRGDDGLGPYIVEGLQDGLFGFALRLHSRQAQDVAGRCGATVRTMILPQLDVTLAPQMCEVDMVIFVDARADDSEELVRTEQIEPTAGQVGPHHTSHTVSIPVLLRIALDWYGVAPLCYAVMPKGYDFSISERISPRARIAAAHARNRIIEILRTHP
jgi:hydrogenase maturation protease